MNIMVIDYHCHIIPGIDDGARSIAESIEIASAAYRLGITGIIATPHYELGLYENDREKILVEVSKLNKLLSQEGIAVKIYPGAEIMLSPETPNLLKSNKLMTLKDQWEEVLVELPFCICPLWDISVLADLRELGIKPILAHPERYNWLKNNQKIKEYHEQGVAFQVNIGSLQGNYGGHAQKMAWYLYRQGLVAYWGTDTHSPQEMLAWGEENRFAQGLEKGF